MNDAKETEQNILAAQISVLNQLLTVSELSDSDKFIVASVVTQLQDKGLLTEEVLKVVKSMVESLTEVENSAEEKIPLKQVNFRAPLNEYEEFKAECERNKLPMSTYFRFQMTAFVEHHKEQREARGLMVKPVETPEENE